MAGTRKGVQLGNPCGRNLEPKSRSIARFTFLTPSCSDKADPHPYPTAGETPEPWEEVEVRTGNSGS